MSTPSPRIPDSFETHLTTRSLDQLQRLLEWSADVACGRGSKGPKPWGSMSADWAHRVIAQRIAQVSGVVAEPERRNLIAEIDELKKRVAALEAGKAS